MARGPLNQLPGAAEPAGDKEREECQQQLALPAPSETGGPLMEALNNSTFLLKESCTRFTEEELLSAAKALAAAICTSPDIPISSMWKQQPHLRKQLTLWAAGALVVLMCIFSLACAAFSTQQPTINGGGVLHTAAGGLTIKTGLAVKHVGLADLPMVSSQDLSFLRDVVLWTEVGDMHVLRVDRAVRYSASHVALDLQGGHTAEFMAGQHFLHWSDGTRDRIASQAGEGMGAAGGYFVFGGMS